MLISHEVPIKLLEESREFNDYDYCLVHLIDRFPKYKDFYIKSVKGGRRVILDNSVFELGEAFNTEDFINKIKEISPTEYIVPDVLNSQQETIRRFADFIDKSRGLSGIKIGVVQGSTYSELYTCYEYMSEKADKIALSFDSIYYKNLYKSDNMPTLSKWCYGRQFLINKLIEDGVWNYNKPHHLLGCSLVKEFSSDVYKNLNIESLDTSNPVVFGIEGSPYPNMAGFKTKSAVKLCDYIDIDLSAEQKKHILHNVAMFRQSTIY